MHRPQVRPHLLDGVEFGTTDSEGAAVVISPTGACFQAGAKELRLLMLADGTRTLGQITERLGHELGTVFNGDDIAFAVAQLADYGLVSRNPAHRVPRRPASGRSIFRMVRPLADPSSWLSRNGSLTRLAGGPAGLLCVFACSATGGTLLATRWEELARTLTSLATVSSTPRYALAWGIALVAFALHELAHAVVAARFGARVRQIGVMLLFFQPCLYTDASDAWRLDRRHRLWISMAGVLANLSFIGTALIAWAILDPWLGGVFLLVAMIVGLSTVVNLNPMLPFDGYFALMDLLGVVNLRQQGMVALADIIHRRGKDERRVQKRRGLFLCFGIASLTYTVVAMPLIALVAMSLLGYALGAAAVLLMIGAGVLSFRRDFVARGWGRRVPRRPVVRPGVLGRRLPGGDKELFRQTGENVLLDGDGGLADRLLRELDGRPVRSVAKSLGVPRSRVSFLLRPLAWYGFLTEAPSDRERVAERYERNLVLLSYLDSGSAWKAQHRLHRSRVAVAGMPGWCEWVALHLCAAGVAEVLVCELDSARHGPSGGPPFPGAWLDRFRPDGPARHVTSRELVAQDPDLIVFGCVPPQPLKARVVKARIRSLLASREASTVELTTLDDEGGRGGAGRAACTASDQASSGIAALEAIRMLLGADRPAAQAVAAPPSEEDDFQVNGNKRKESEFDAHAGDERVRARA